MSPACFVQLESQKGELQKGREQRGHSTLLRGVNPGDTASRFVNDRDVRGKLTLVTQQESRLSHFSLPTPRKNHRLRAAAGLAKQGEGSAFDPPRGAEPLDPRC
jgi:hypothetical protein